MSRDRENGNEEMKTEPITSSLSSVAAAAASKRTPGTSAMGVGLELEVFMHGLVRSMFSKMFHSTSGQGTVTALIGPSGCGKSTFIRTLNRMHEFIPGAAMAGEVLLDGSDIYSRGVDVTKIRLKVGMVFQKPNPFPSMTIAEMF